MPGDRTRTGSFTTATEVQYLSIRYSERLAEAGIEPSVGSTGDSYDNAMAERVNGILKTEFLLQRPKDLEQARQMVRESIAIYNTERPHLALKYKTPDAVHRAF